jgi:hypothetical protein
VLALIELVVKVSEVVEEKEPALRQRVGISRAQELIENQEGVAIDA